LGDLPPTPPYFARMKRINADGPALLSSLRNPAKLPAIAPAAVAALLADGAVLIDFRTSEDFGAGHPSGALNIGFGSKIGYWAGWVVPPDVPIVLLSEDPSQLAEAATQLFRVGLDRVEGALAGGFEAWSRAGLPIESIEQIAAAELRDAVKAGEPMQLLDVRSPKEYADGHVDGAINIPVGELASRAGELRRDAPTAVMCEGGYRSALAASLLQQEGFARLANVTGGMAAFREVVTR